MRPLAVFLAGAAIGAVAAALLTPESGEDLRARIKMLLMKRGIIPADDVNEFIEMIASEVEER